MISLFKEVLKPFPSLYVLAQRVYPFATLLVALMKGRRGSIEHLRSSWSLIRRSTFVAGRPVNVTLEPTNICNLRCPVCETGAGELGRSPRQMTVNEFQCILNKIAPHTNTMMFYFMGEPFLNQDAYQMIRAAKEAGIPWITTCTNGETLNPEELVKSGINEVNFQIGGVSGETHRRYRVNGELERVLYNLRETVRIKRKLHKSLHIVCGMILMRHNQHEVATFHQSMVEIGVDEALVIDPCVRTMAQARAYLPSDERYWIYDPHAYLSGELRPRILPGNQCDWLYYSLTILANGDVVPCCRDPKGKHVMGNLLNQELAEIWNGEPFRTFRGSVLREQSSVAVCRLCSGYPASSLK